MYELKLNWKEYNINLAMVVNKMKEDYESIYLGSAADYCFKLYFSEEPSQEMINDIVSYWQDLNEESEEAASYVSTIQRKTERDNKVKQIKLAMVDKTWADMGSPERKLAVGLDEEVTDEELSDLLD